MSGHSSADRRKLPHGYTLLELLLVLAILSTVAALSFPRVHRTLESARQQEAVVRLQHRLTELRTQAIRQGVTLELDANEIRTQESSGHSPDEFLQSDTDVAWRPRLSETAAYRLGSEFRLRMDPSRVFLLPTGRASSTCRLELFDGEMCIGAVRIDPGGNITSVEVPVAR